MRTHEERAKDRRKRVGEVLDWVRVLRCHRDRRLEGVVLLVDVLVDGRVVEPSMHPVKHSVVHHDAAEELRHYRQKVGDVGAQEPPVVGKQRHAEVKEDGADKQVAEQHIDEALPDHLRVGGALVKFVLWEQLEVVEQVKK